MSVKMISDDLRAFLISSVGPKVIMLCGMSGAGKSTFARVIASQYGLERLSIDHIIAESFGLYDIDYGQAKDEFVSRAGDQKVNERLRELLRDNQSVVIDRCFWCIENRETCYQLLKEEGVNAYKLVYLRAGKEFLWDRVQDRNKEALNPDNARAPDRDLFEKYWGGFEGPSEEEHAIVIDVEDHCKS